MREKGCNSGGRTGASKGKCRSIDDKGVKKKKGKKRKPGANFHSEGKKTPTFYLSLGLHLRL